MKANARLLASAAIGALILAQSLPALAQSNTQAQPSASPPMAPAPSAAATPMSNDQTVVLSQFVVTGDRASLASAQEFKENSQEMMDSIVADDIGKLPDVNVAYALERITGVQVAHIFAGVGGNGAVTINGLTQVENTVDGREVFTAGGTSGGGVGNGQRTFDYADIASALVAGIDVYKSAAADQLDGGLGGTIDVRLHKPFDFDGLATAVTIGTTYSSLDNEDKPNYNVLVSDTAKTSIGKIGILVDATYTVQPWREDNIGVGNPTPVTVGSTTALMPTGYTTDTAEGVFQTTGVNAVLQWEPVKGLQVYAGYNFEDGGTSRTSTSSPHRSRLRRSFPVPRCCRRHQPGLRERLLRQHDRQRLRHHSRPDGPFPPVLRGRQLDLGGPDG